MNETTETRHQWANNHKEERPYTIKQMEEDFFAMKKPPLDDTLDEQTIKQILFDKRRELDMTPLLPKHLQKDSPLHTLLCAWFWEGTEKIIEDWWINKHKDPIRKCIKKLEYILRNRYDKESGGGHKEIDLDAKKAEIPIRDFIGSYIVLPHRARHGSLIPCPLPKHKDWTASFMIYDRNNRWKCFGCNAGGTHIDFIMHMEWVSVAEAVKKFINY